MGRLIVGIALGIVGLYVIWTAWRLFNNRDNTSKYGIQLGTAVVIEVVLLILLGRIPA
jgi:divalent metal cation (Fe/Co/Zn/Cd) transporter